MVGAALIGGVLVGCWADAFPPVTIVNDSGVEWREVCARQTIGDKVGQEECFGAVASGNQVRTTIVFEDPINTTTYEFSVKITLPNGAQTTKTYSRQAVFDEPYGYVIVGRINRG